MQFTTTPDLTADVMSGRLAKAREGLANHEATPVMKVLKTNKRGEPVVVQHVCTQCDRLVTRVAGGNKHV